MYVSELLFGKRHVNDRSLIIVLGCSCLIGIALGLVISPSKVSAQASAAAINGTVKDTSEAVIPQANVTLINTATSVTRTTQTNTAGEYVVLNILPGQYTLQVSKEGFVTQTQAPFVLNVNQTTTFDFTLPVGSSKQTITVEAAAGRLETSTSELGTAVATSEVNSLPLNGRNFTQLLELTPGTSPVNTGQNAGGFKQNPVGSFIFPEVNGQTMRSNMYLLDGMNDLHGIAATYGVPPVLDDIQEFKVVSHNDEAAFGGVLGGIVDVVTKSGSNQLHGTGWEFLRNSGLDARNPFYAKVNPLRWNQFGANVGGPVILPHYNGRNRTFFFGSYEGVRIHQASNILYTVPTAAELGGDLSSFSTPIYNPFSTTPDPAHPGEYLRTQFQGNIIPSNLIDPNMVTIAKAIFPAPVYTGLPNINGLDTTPSITDSNEYNMRIDEELGAKNALWWRFTHDLSPSTASGGIQGLVHNGPYRAYETAGNWQHTFGPSSILVIGLAHDLGVDHDVSLYTNVNEKGLIQSANISPNFGCGMHSPSGCLIPGFGISGFVSNGEGYTMDMPSDIYQARADFSKVVGRHSLRVGADISHAHFRATPTGSSVTFSTSQTSDLEAAAGEVTGLSLASFLLGVPDSASQRNTLESEHGMWVEGYYFQDQWKVTDRLTANFGLRYDLTLFPVYGHITDGSAYSGDPNLSNGTYIVEDVPPLCSVVGVAPCIPGTGLPAHTVASPNGKIFQNTYDNIQPRLGLAYRIGTSTVLRASGGRFFDNWASYEQTGQNYEGSWPSTGQRLAVNLNTPFVNTTAENPFAGPGGASLPAPSPFTQVQWDTDPGWKNPYSWQWNFGVQHQFGASNVLTANYVGSAGSRLDNGWIKNTAATPGPGDPTLRQPYPYIEPTYYDQSISRSNYNAFQFILERKAGHGVTYVLSYTYSRTEDIGCDGWYGVEGCSIETPYNLDANKSVAQFDLTHVLDVGGVYKLPFGYGQKYQAGSRALNYLIGGWQINGILTMTSGAPYTVTVDGDIANIGYGSERPNLVGNPTISNPSPSMWLNPAAFAVPAPFTFGNLGRNTLRGDWFKDFDFSLFREFPVTERHRFEFRVEAFNSTNTPTWGTPVSDISALNFGVITSTRSTERQVQFALKYYF